MPNIIEITTPDAPGLDLFAHLTNAQLRSRSEPEKGIFIAESPKVIRIALDAGYEPVAMLMERKHLLNQGQPLIERCSDIPIYTGDREMLAGITGYTLTRGILCAMKRPAPLTLAEVCGDAHRIAVLDGIVDATNIGAIFRSAAAMHMDGVLVTPTCCDPLNRRAVRVSMGTVFQIPWAQIGSCSAQWPVDGMQMLHKMGFRTAAMALSQDSVSIEDPGLMAEDKLAVILGTEGDGLSQQTIDLCDYTVMIPMSHGVDSLNVAAAGAVAFWQLRKR